MTSDARCAARRYGNGQMHCAACRLTWDADDPEPPTCGRMVRLVEPYLEPPAPRLEFASGLRDW